MVDNGNGYMLYTPKVSALIWRYLPSPKGSDMRKIGVLLPYGTAYFRFFQLRLDDYMRRGLKTRSTMRKERGALVKEWFDFSRLRPRMVTLNEMAAEIWERCHGRMTIQDLVSEVAQVTGRDEDRIREETTAFLDGAHRQGIINLNYPDAPREGYLAIIQRELESGTLKGLVRDLPAAREVASLLSLEREKVLF